MTPDNLDALRDWLGPEGAMAGLEKSDITNADLMFLARACKVEVSNKSPRRQLVIDLVMGPVNRVLKPIDELLAMSRDEIKRYLSEQFVSTKELTKLLEEMGIEPRTRGKARLLDFAASEISDLGAYQRIARGNERIKAKD